MQHAKVVPMNAIFKPRISKARAVEWAGSAAELAKRLDISQSAVSQWEDEIPEGRLWQLHALGCPDDQSDDQ
jgi:DNA-binding transcriptional regulator YdaS (Cro superfamily)